ncbi:MAG TPA: trypsin-like peptidase domain-containing protein [Mycobacterium sp.]|nr:trypsin-like peptidase domain-containing protein [Mycobacterium sp.]
MRILAIVLGLALLLAACGQPAGPVRTTSMRVQLADDPHKIPVAVPVNPDPRVGPIFLLGDIVHTCTGSVVHSSTGDLILTAAHCLARGFPTTFVPGFANAAAPSDVWTVDAVYLDPLWVAFKDPRVDYAFARVSRAGGGSVEAQVGSALLLGTAPAPGSQVSIIGYAAGVGGTPIGCQASTGITASGYPSFRCAGLVVGTSGAPWIRGSTVTGVTGGLQNGGCTPDVSYSAQFDERTAALLARAEAGGPGEAAPIAFISC